MAWVRFSRLPGSFETAGSLPDYIVAPLPLGFLTEEGQDPVSIDRTGQCPAVTQWRGVSFNLPQLLVHSRARRDPDEKSGGKNPPLSFFKTVRIR